MLFLLKLSIILFLISSCENLKICHGNTPCGWIVYERYTKKIESYLKSSCDCPSSLSCMLYKNNILIDAYTYTCQKNYKLLELVNDKKYETREPINILIGAWKPDNSLQDGIYEILLEIKYELPLTIASIDYKKNESNNWNTFNDYPTLSIYNENFISVGCDKYVYSTWNYIPFNSKYKLKINTTIPNKWEFKILQTQKNFKLVSPDFKPKNYKYCK